MAIDRNRLKDLIGDIDELFQGFSAPLGERARQWIETAVMGPAFAELREFIEESRPPVLFLAGRSGHGKSSVINALAGKKIAETGHVKPTTPQALAHLISFPERFATWQVVDSRGIFETSPPGGAPAPDATRALSDAMLKHRPDVVLHVIATPEVRALANDLRVMSEIMDGLRGQTGGETPLVVVLSKPDIIGNPREWPPERYSRKAAQIKEALDYFVSDALQIRTGFRPLDLNTPYRGYEFEANSRNVFCVVPVFALEEEEAWNVETLVGAIGERLPKSARLDFYQAQQRKEFLRRLSDSVIKRFAAIATAIGTSPIPVADIAVLTPLQLMMIAVVAGLSCRQLSVSSATQYLTAAGINVGGAVGMRTVAQQLIKLIPGAGPMVSGGIAGAGTYALGKSAQGYFFSGELKRPEEFEQS
jgi:uncharacterized protein (DUF697 family)